MSPEERAERRAEIERVHTLGVKALRRAQKLESEYWQAVRGTTPVCDPPSKHDCQIIYGNAFSVYRCRICGDEEWL